MVRRPYQIICQNQIWVFSFEELLTLFLVQVLGSVPSPHVITLHHVHTPIQIHLTAITTVLIIHHNPHRSSTAVEFFELKQQFSILESCLLSTCEDATKKAVRLLTLGQD